MHAFATLQPTCLTEPAGEPYKSLPLFDLMFNKFAAGAPVVAESRQLVGKSAAMQNVLHEIEAAARTESKVLITGESGVGKEVAAALIHEASRRSRGPLVTINCAAITDTLLESELFGHERGSFTGAYRDRPGLLELGNRGTVFLDEIGEMTLRMQGLLLRFLETGEIQRVGSVRVGGRVDVRVLAATNRNLIEHIEAKIFREDLYYRLNVFRIGIPALRERREDVPELLDHFLRVFRQQYGVSPSGFSPEALEALTQYDWPGNIRELKNLVERLVVRIGTTLVTPADLPREVLGQNIRVAEPVPGRPSVADEMFTQMTRDRQSFWSVVYPPFMSRDLTRDDLRRIVARGLAQTSGNYKLLVTLFNMGPHDYKRFLNFLRKHHCHMPFQQFRTLTQNGGSGNQPEKAQSSGPALPASA
jgi:DNA-binding NtrC family response regulator